MKANVEAICYKVRPLKNGEYPLMLRITQSRKRKYVSIGMSIQEKHWDFDKNKPKRNCPNKEKIERLIANKINEYNTLIVDLTTDQGEYTPETLVNTLDNKVRARTVEEMYHHIPPYAQQWSSFLTRARCIPSAMPSERTRPLN